MTCNVHHTWATFLYEYPLLPYLFPTKTAQPHTLFYSGTLIQGHRHFLMAALSVQSCIYRSLRVTIKLDSAAID